MRARARPYDVPAAQKVCHVRAQASNTARTSNLHAARVATGERYEGDVPVLRRAQGVWLHAFTGQVGSGGNAGRHGFACILATRCREMRCVV